MDIVTYALLKKKMGELSEKVDEKTAMLDAGLTPVLSYKNGKTNNSITDKVWDGLTNDRLDVFAVVDGVLIKTKYGVNGSGDVVITDKNDNTIGTITKSGNLYSVVWDNSVTDVDISAAEQGIYGGSDNFVTQEKLKLVLGNGGIKEVSYATLFNGEFSVTTSDTTGYIKPYARASVSGRLSKHYLYKVTINGVQYILPSRLWYSIADGYMKVYEYIGNLNLFVSDTTGVPGEIDSNCNFIIISDYISDNAIEVLTDTAGTYQIKVERIDIEKKLFDKSLIYGTEYQPFEMKNSLTSTYNGYSIGVNTIKNPRGTIAIGYGNTVSNEFSVAIGNGNTISSDQAFAIGAACNVSGTYGFACGFGTTVSGAFGNAVGNETIASGQASHAEGNRTTASGKFSHAEGSKTLATHSSQHVFGRFNIADTSTATSTDLGNYIEIVGNGASDASRSNARTLDWSGNERLAGDVYVHSNTDGSGGTKLVSVTDYANQTTGGVVKIIENGSGGLQIDQGYLTLMAADVALIKSGSNATLSPITPGGQYAATFYGLATAAGDTTQKNSANAVGTYTDSAKSAIRTMLSVAPAATLQFVLDANATITAQANTEYVCGTVTSLNFTPCAVGVCSVRFTSGTTATTLTLPNTVKMPDWFNASALEANRIYEINIEDGVRGVVMSWAA